MRDETEPEYTDKTSRCRVEYQQTQSTYDAESVNRTRATLVAGEYSHHCAILPCVISKLTEEEDDAEKISVSSKNKRKNKPTGDERARTTMLVEKWMSESDTSFKCDSEK